MKRGMVRCVGTARDRSARPTRSTAGAIPMDRSITATCRHPTPASCSVSTRARRWCRTILVLHCRSNFGARAPSHPAVLYTSGDCHACEDARVFLRQRGVPYSERTVEGAGRPRNPAPSDRHRQGSGPDARQQRACRIQLRPTGAAGSTRPAIPPNRACRPGYVGEPPQPLVAARQRTREPRRAGHGRRAEPSSSRIRPS